MAAWLCLACAGAPHAPQRAAPSQPSHLLAKGHEFAAQGQSVRAEQYYLAARSSGADPDEIFQLVVETCVASGRLGSALAHVRAHLRLHPEDNHLLQLAASLNDALGHDATARELVGRLHGSQSLSASGELYVAEFLDRKGLDREGAIARYRGYLTRTPATERAPWVEPALRRLLAAPLPTVTRPTLTRPTLTRAPSEQQDAAH